MCFPIESTVKFEADYSALSHSFLKQPGPKVTIAIQNPSFRLEQSLSIDLPESSDCDKTSLSFRLQYPSKGTETVDILRIPTAIARTMVFTTQYKQVVAATSFGAGRAGVQLAGCETPVSIVDKPEFKAGGHYVIHFSRIEGDDYDHGRRIENEEPIIDAIIEEIVDPENPDSIERAKIRAEAEKIVITSWAAKKAQPSTNGSELPIDELQSLYQLCLKDYRIATRILKESIRNGDKETESLAKNAWEKSGFHLAIYHSALQERGCPPIKISKIFL